MRLLPRSLFGRLMLVLASGLIVAQLLSAAINLVERDSVLVRASGMQPAQRIADIVTLLDSLSPAERERIVGILNVPPLVVSLDRPPVRRGLGCDGRGARRDVFRGAARRAGRRPAASGGHARHAAGMGARRRTRARSRSHGRWTDGRTRHAPISPGRRLVPDPGPPAGRNLGDVRHPGRQESATLPWRVLLTLAILLAAVLLLSYVAVRWVTRPLHLLATAADELGRDINRPPLPEGGPLEVSRAARAFNTMQTRLVRFIDERTRLLTAMSHDLKTPLTRMRLRAELLEDEDLREKFETDLLEMEAMVTQTLEFMRGLSNREPTQLVDIMGLLESLQADNEAMGRTVTIDGRVTRPWTRSTATAQALPLESDRQRGPLRQAGGDPGRGRSRPADPSTCATTVPEYRKPRSRKCSSRSIGSKARAAAKPAERDSASSIARNIAQAHGGDVRLRNHEGGGLEAILTLPWNREEGVPTRQAAAQP